MPIDPTLMGREYYTVDPNTKYKFRGIVVSGTILVVGELTDAKGSTLVTHKITDVKFPPVP
jgi:hypothetical protein